MLYLTQQIKQKIINLSFNADSENIYGYLLGFEKREIRIIEEIVLINTANKNKSQKNFPNDFHNVEQYAEENGLILLGTLVITQNYTVYPIQDKNMINRDYFSSLIVSVSAGAFIKLSSWRFDVFNKYIEERIVVVNNQDYNITNINNLKELSSMNYN